MDFRVILYHKQVTSARTRFVRFNKETIFAFGKLVTLSQLLENPVESMLIHPAAIMQQTEEQLGLPAASLKAETEFQQAIEIPGGGSVQILLANITSIDPPFDMIEKAGGDFIDLTQARGLPQLELDLLRTAYELILGG